MKTYLHILLLIIFFGCASKAPKGHPSGLVIVEINPNKQTALTKQNLLQLAQVYDLSPFLFTKLIHVQSQVVSQPHPIILLNTRNAEYPKKLLSAFLHEQLHWWLQIKKLQTIAAIKELKKIYPKAPATRSAGPDSTYIHLLVCHLELRALAFYLGKAEARKVIIEIMKKDKVYPWIYHQVLNNDFAMRKVIRKHQLLPAQI